MRTLTTRERAGMAALVGTLAAFGIGGSTCLSRQSAGDDNLLVPPATSAPPSITVPARSGSARGESGGAGDTDAAAAPLADSGSTNASAATATTNKTIIVYVSGAVKKPGIVKMHQGDRIFQAIHQAGGFKPNAVKEALNLADRVQDGDQINVPTPAPASARLAGSAAVVPPIRHAEPAPAPSGRNGTDRGRGAASTPRPGRVLGRTPGPMLANAGARVRSSFAPAASAASDAGANGAAAAGGEQAASDNKLRSPGDGTININTADSSELQRLVRCGPAMAERIIAYRQQIGRFSAPEQLMDVQGVGEKTFEKWQPFVVVR